MESINAAQKIIYLQKMLVKLSFSVIKHQSNSHPNKTSPSIYRKYCHLLYSQWIPQPRKIVNIPLLDQLGEIYTIEFPSGGYNMVWRESVELTTATPRFTLDRKNTDSPSIEASPGTNHFFVTTHKYHMNPPFTFPWDLTSAQNIDLVSLSRYLKYLTLRGDQVVNLHDFHNDVSIALSSSENTNIEVLS